VNAQKKNTPKIHFIHLSNTEIYWILKTHCIILFSTQCSLFQNIFFSVHIILMCQNLNTKPAG